jgi:hypothetical protein
MLGRDSMKLTRSTLAVALAGFAFLALAPATQAQTFSTSYAWNGTSFANPFGFPDTATYGQTFIAPGNPLLNFTFYVNALGNTLSMQADVYAWSGSLIAGNPTQGAVGPALYTSPTSIVLTGTGFQAVTVTTGSVPLTAGSDYIALLTVSDPTDYNATTGPGQIGLIAGTHVSGDGGGGFNFFNNGYTQQAVNNGDWDDYADYGDLAWTSHFGPAVPEPGTYTLLGSLGLTGVIFLRRRRTR